MTLHATRSKGKRKRRVLFPGIIEHARALGVNRVTLYRVLKRQWKLPGLLRRYEALLKQEAK